MQNQKSRNMNQKNKQNIGNRDGAITEKKIKL